MYNQDKLKEFYDQDVERRASLKVHDWKQMERGRFLEEIQRDNAETLLELGAGTGKHSLFFMERDLDVTAVDLSEGMVKHCQNKGVNAKQMDFMQLEFPDQSFDAVYALNSLLHTPKRDLENVLQGIKRIMKPNALFYMGVYGGKDFEGILEEDTFEPKRFYAYYKTQNILE